MSHKFKINDVDYEFEFKLSNPDGQQIEFTKSAILGMNISESMFDPFLDGSISIANPYDFIENEYFIRGDGRDEFRIMFKEADKDPKIDHVFIVTDEEDAGNVNSRAENIKTFTLVSKDSVAFSEKFPYSKSYTGKVGDILKDIFIEILGEDKVDGDNWESGDFQIENYTPPSVFRYMDVIRYFMRIFYAKDGDLYVKGIINLDRNTNKYRLDLISKIYSDNKKNLIESFAVADLVNEIGVDNPNNPNIDSAMAKHIGTLRNLGYSTPQYGWTTDFFINALVIGYNNVLGKHVIKKLDFEKVRQRWASKFVKQFKSLGGEPKEFAVKNNTTKRKFIKFHLPWDINHAVNIVEAEMHNFLTFQNLQLTFSNLGVVSRTSGKFIDIFSPKKNGQVLKSDEKLLGRWLITHIDHNFTRNFYSNTIFCTKTYIGPNAKIKEDIE